ncbi:beta-glucosidase H [Jiangella anatolica]|uniref:Glycosyl hydrolase n=1 Tax=Jiangella anatolica TaxID=2670374 RepID=A0A2W2B9A1_9ACTN|nr:glycoside hydrolase family 3 C-terminal domain-containing protein [Jiangella anatolica]PZF83825.1 glycosyl hydrolase [Jiangella anatolica]
MTADDHARLTGLIRQLTLEEKVALVSGADVWTTTPIERIGLRAMVLSDGPAGVRGPVWDERSPSLSLPSGTALASSWDPALAYRFGAVAAAEARRQGVDVVLGPTINLHRSPLGGRHFECFSEDPLLTGELAAAYVRGLQDHGVAATPKHYVANDSETERFTVDVRVGERALRELYLRPFELAVEVGAWAVMSAYNSVGGVTMTENALLETPLNTQWGFDGVVVSDWTAVRSLDAATAAQDLAMPGPAPAWSDALLAAVRDGRVGEEQVDRKVLRLLRLAQRVGALDDTATPASPVAVDGVAFAREAAVEGTVLLRNEGELPWDRPALRRVAVIGHNAKVARTQGGGSATVIPEHVVSPLDGIRAALPETQVDYELGAVVQEGVAELPLDRLTNPVTGEPGIRVAFLDTDGAELLGEDRRSTALVWLGGDAPIAAASRIELTTTFTPEADEDARLGFAAVATGRVYVNDELIIDETPALDGGDLAAAFLAPPSVTEPVRLVAGRQLRIRAEFDLGPAEGPLTAFAVTLGLASGAADPDDLIAGAARAAADADVAVVVVGTNARVESEGYDRTALALPGRQDDLVRAVAAANPRTVVVVNAGAPVLLPWRDEVAAVVLGYFGGQEAGAALADVLLGAAEPGGRLTTTWPAAVEDVPVLDVTPHDGVLDYDEDIHIGYRAWLKAGTEPAFPFGFGLGYTTWSLDALQVDGDVASGAAVARVTLTNTGTRPGKQVVQLYAERDESAVDRPVRWLVGWSVVRAAAGEHGVVDIPLPSRAFEHWDGGRDGGWALEPGDVRLRAGVSVTDLPLDVTVTVPGVDLNAVR